MDRITAPNRKCKKKKGVDKDLYPNACPTDVDSHADTHCSGRNYKPIHWTG